jgi:hypothetical protein
MSNIPNLSYGPLNISSFLFPNYGCINYGELATGYKIVTSNSQGQSNGTRKFICNWRDAPAFAAFLRTASSPTFGGYPLIILGTLMGIGGISITSSVSCGGMSSSSSSGSSNTITTGFYQNLYCQTVDIEPLIPELAIGAAQWNHAILTCHYMPLPFNGTDIRTDTFGTVTKELPMTGSTTTLPSGAQPYPDPVYTLTYQTWNCTFHHVAPGGLTNYIDDSVIGTTNSELITIRNTDGVKTVPIGFGIYAGMSNMTVNQSIDGIVQIDLTHSFLISPVDVNKMFDATLPSGPNVLTNFVTPSSGLTAQFNSVSWSGLGV